MNKDTNKYLSREAEISNPNQPTLFSLSGFGKKKILHRALPGAFAVALSELEKL